MRERREVGMGLPGCAFWSAGEQESRKGGGGGGGGAEDLQGSHLLLQDEAVTMAGGHGGD